ncbi:hypothetical protein GDO81_006899 [Engystomops pustulosus]|uniref:Uncharacterized protein n=1 Tax=Engystomops pustulosus TaxID=76066 RepID=A0AAV7D0U5_ENGPU|nr:hypothetical protein GDO81_006899 [Engystomops pustulosus]
MFVESNCERKISEKNLKYWDSFTKGPNCAFSLGFRNISDLRRIAPGFWRTRSDCGASAPSGGVAIRKTDGFGKNTEFFL